MPETICKSFTDWVWMVFSKAVCSGLRDPYSPMTRDSRGDRIRVKGVCNSIETLANSDLFASTLELDIVSPTRGDNSTIDEIAADWLTSSIFIVGPVEQFSVGTACSPDCSFFLAARKARFIRSDICVHRRFLWRNP